MKKTFNFSHTETVRSQTVKNFYSICIHGKYMTTAEQKGCYTHILFLFQILCYYFAHENRNYPFCSTCLFFKIYDFGYQTLFSGI